jgi:hypothetical protein
MTLLSEIDVAEKLEHPFFSGGDVSDIAKKKRVRQLARRAKVCPVIMKRDIWLFHEKDMERLIQCRSSFVNEKDHHTGRSRVRSAGNAFERVQQLLTEERRS